MKSSAQRQPLDGASLGEALNMPFADTEWHLKSICEGWVRLAVVPVAAECLKGNWHDCCWSAKLAPLAGSANRMPHARLARILQRA